MKISSPSLNIFYNLFYFRGFFPTLSSSLEYSFFTWNLSIFRPYLAVFSHWIYTTPLWQNLLTFRSTIVFLLFFLYVCCLRFQYFQPSAELCFFVHIILQVCAIWFKKFRCVFVPFASHLLNIHYLPGIYLFLDLILPCYYIGWVNQ